MTGQGRTDDETAPAGFLMRAPRRDDLAALVSLMRACDMVEFGRPDTDDADVLAEWDSTGFALAVDARVAVEKVEPAGDAVADGGATGHSAEGCPQTRVVGYAHAFERYVEVIVHPEHNNRGIGTALRLFAEQRALEQADPTAPAKTGSAGEATAGTPSCEVKIWQAPRRTNTAAQTLLAEAGYTPGHHYVQMEVDLAQEPPQAMWPEGMTVRTFAPGRDEQACHELQNLAWSQYETYEPISFERWTDMTREPDFDPSIWFLAEENGQLAGMCLCREYEDQAWVPWLAVHPERRGRGLGEALLRHAFARLRARGNVRVGLSVSSRSTRSAWRLYERAGMHDAGGWIAYEKVPRAAEPS